MIELLGQELRGTFNAVPFPIAALRIAAALILAGIIGLEREWREKPAGLRTHMLVSLAACLYFIVGRELATVEFGDVGEMRVDPLRIIEAVTAGVAFLVAGIIFTSGGKVKNITTGASLWLAGAIGLGCGAGLIPLAALVTVTVVVVLTVIGALERRTGHQDAED